ncbi:hypothetical protein ACFWF3_28080 [Nocardia sp. NPDC060220]|uniref:hypothetical protein n=1 Tax=Nocardia sp. NPDC060220 TaxID=3347076 RepID=UPI0036597A54
MQSLFRRRLAEQRCRYGRVTFGEDLAIGEVDVGAQAVGVDHQAFGEFDGHRGCAADQ